jgi:hypothetical protein
MKSDFDDKIISSRYFLSFTLLSNEERDYSKQLPEFGLILLNFAT